MKPSKQRESPSKSKSASSPGSARAFIVWGTVIAAMVVLALIAKRGQQPVSSESGNTALRAEQDTVTNVGPVAASQSAFNLQKLTGKWLRPDGGYIIEIKSVDGAGKLEAGYFNPRPIHVSKAEAKQEGNATKVFIELQDVNYPGSTYTLVYVPERDLLAGNYFQALQKQNFEVYFERLK